MKLAPVVLHGHEVWADSTSVSIRRLEFEVGSGFVLFWGICWTVGNAYLFIAQFGLVPVGWEWTRQLGHSWQFHVDYATPSPGGLLLFGVFLIVGAGVLVSAMESRYGEQEWFASDNFFRVRVGLFGLNRTHEFRNAKFHIFKSHEEEGEAPCWNLLITGCRGLKARHLVFIRSATETEAAELQELALLLAERTGWPLLRR